MAFLYHLLFFLLLLHYQCNAGPIGWFCNEDKVISSDRTSKAIDRVLAELVQKATTDGFATTSYEKIYGLIQCRGDVSTEDCSACISDAAKQVRQLCPKGVVDGRIWYDYCFLRYDTENFIGKLDTGFGIIYLNVKNVTDPIAFHEKLGALMEKVQEDAVLPANHGLGKGKTKFTPFITIYALVQCNGDLSKLSCAQCLAIATSNFPNYCEKSQGCQINYSSCRVRFEIYPFFFPLDSAVKMAVTSSVLKVVVYP